MINSKAPKLIGLVGYAKSGKNTVANIMVAKYRFASVAFSDQLKAGLAKTFEPLIDPQVWHDVTKKEAASPWGPTYRDIMQWYGTEFGRDMINPNLWVDLLEPVVKGYLEGNRSVVISDVRFHSEADMIIKLGGCLVSVENCVTEVAPHVHSSETFIPELRTRCLGGTIKVDWSEPSETLGMDVDALLTKLVTV